MSKIYQTAHYRVNDSAVDRVVEAVEEFVAYVTDNEPGTLLYAAWQSMDEPSAFIHLFTFADETAHQTHGKSAAVRKFESVYQPELADGPVRFTDYRLVAANRGD